LGAKAIDTSDEFFAPKERMLDPNPAIFAIDKYDDHGKWLAGWLGVSPSSYTGE
jgi:allantoicase